MLSSSSAARSKPMRMIMVTITDIGTMYIKSWKILHYIGTNTEAGVTPEKATNNLLINYIISAKSNASDRWIRTAPILSDSSIKFCQLS